MSRWRFVLTLLAVLLVMAIAVLVAMVVEEMRSSRLQAHYLSRLAAELHYDVRPGISAHIRFPGEGPYDLRLGYSRLPAFIERATARGYTVSAQANISPRMEQIADRGLFLPYPEKTQAGLSLAGCGGVPIYSVAFPERVFASFDEVPRLMSESLLFIENRELFDERHPEHNPAIEWDRFGKAVVDRAWQMIDPDHDGGGGSTLATQIEKYRHSPEGRTTSGSEKLRQMASASIRAYMGGEDTRPERRRIVLEYLNTVPLSARAGFGEVNGMGDGLWAWYGRDLTEVSRLLADPEAGRIGAGAPATDQLAARALAYKQMLSLMIAQRRPSYYLGGSETALENLTDRHLRLLGELGVISPKLRDAALEVKLAFRRDNPAPRPVSFVTRKAATALRTSIAGLLGVPRLYDLDRIDLAAVSTLNAPVQSAVTDALLAIGDPDVARKSGLVEHRLFAPGDDPAKVLFSFTLFERVGDANLLRIQTDNLDAPFDINGGARLDLGSTAKLRTLISYLEVIAKVHERYADADRETLRAALDERRGPLASWTIEYLLGAKDKSLAAIMAAAMERHYSANPGETFFTGGGQHRFGNFDHREDGSAPTVKDALRNSTNLVFIRIMRDVVRHYMFETPGSSALVLENSDDPRRREYLERFADREGRLFTNRFYAKYRGKTADEVEAILLQGVRPFARRLATVYRSIHPEASFDSFARFMRGRLEGDDPSDERLRQLFDGYSVDQFNLADRGYIAGIHPLELWLAAYLIAHPEADYGSMLEAGAQARQSVYGWLFRTRHKNAQDIRIRSLLEVEAFLEIHRRWQRLGYPFEALTPSYATAIGSSGDRPSALAELIGIIQNKGMRYPVMRLQSLDFASGTPFETHLVQSPGKAERVLPEELTAVVREALVGVAKNGTAKRIWGSFASAEAVPLDIGGKTGTGDHRFEVYGRGGRLVSSRVISRSATFVFLLGDRFFGVITAHVREPYAEKYSFTSALSVQVLKNLAPVLQPLLTATADAACSSPQAVAAPMPPVVPAGPGQGGQEPPEGTPNDITPRGTEAEQDGAAEETDKPLPGLH